MTNMAGQLPALLLAAVTLSFIVWRLWRTHAVKPAVAEMSWRCHTCGYDLRASPERCPECGTLVPPHRRPLDPIKLRDEWPASPIEPRVPGSDEMLVRVWDAPHAMAATLLVEQLCARGIRATVQQKVGPMQIGNYVTPAADHAVSVWSGDADAATIAMMRLARDPDGL